MYPHISNIKTSLDRKVYRSFSRVTLHEHSKVQISVKLINHEHKRDKSLVKPIDQTISPRTGHDVLEELQNILNSEVENLRKYAREKDATLTFQSLPEVQSETIHPRTNYVWHYLSAFKHYWRFLTRKMSLKIRLEVSFILKDKTREDVELQDQLVQTKQDLKCTRKLLNQAMEIIKKHEQSQSEKSKPMEKPAKKKRKRRNGSAKYKKKIMNNA